MNIINPKLEFKKALIPLTLDKVSHIVIHHTASNTQTVENIHKDHLSRGWAGIGYNEFISKSGDVYIGRGDYVGAHCMGYNEISYGISLEGNFDTENITNIQYQSLLNRINHHKTRFKNLSTICGHRDLYSTACPGKNINMQKIISDLENNIKLVEIREIEALVDKIYYKGLITDKTYWIKVLTGEIQVNNEYLKILLNRIQ